MLYVTTRNHQDAFTVHHVLTQSKGTDGGLYLPLHFPKFPPQEIARLSEMSFGQRAAQMLNLFFSTKFTGWDIDFCIGRYPVRTEQLAHRILLAETWHNPDRHYRRIEKNLTELLSAETDTPGNWVSVAVRMAILAGILGNRTIFKRGLVDIAAVTGDFTTPIGLWYLRKMGFPIGNIICCCNENNQFWELVCNGQMHTDCIGISTIVPEADVVLPANLERLISDCGGVMEAQRYQEACRSGVPYCVSEPVLQQLRQGFCVNVVSSSRVKATIPNVYRTHNYILSPASALAYSGLLDYRTKTGITRSAIVLCDQNPICSASVVASSMDIPVEELQELI